MGVLWRNRPRAQLGSLPWHYTLDALGAQIVAEHLGLELKAVGYREDRKRTLVDNPRLGHTRAVNGSFTRMHHIARTTEGTARIVEWRGEAWCARRWQEHVRSDGFARIEDASGSLEFVLELDLGTENRGRLEDKMERYRVLARAATAPDIVLFCFPSEVREASARHVLGGTAMQVATATIGQHLANPFGTIWLPLNNDRRVRLINLQSRSRA